MMRVDHTLTALMAERRILLRGDGSIAEAAKRRLAALELPVVREDALATDAIVTWEPAPLTPDELGTQVQQLTNLLETGNLRRVVLVLADGAPVAMGVAETLTLYAAAHLVQKQTRFNMVRLPASPTASALERATNATLMLMCGRMDAVHGQVLSIAEEHAEVRP